MKFEPIPEDKLNTFKPLRPGEADFEVVDAEETVSKAGNDMLKVKLKVYDSTGKEGRIFEYFPNNVQWKLITFLKSVGKRDLYDTGDIDSSQFIGLMGKCVLTLESTEKGDVTKIKQFKPKLNVKESASIDIDDDIPF